LFTAAYHAFGVTDRQYTSITEVQLQIARRRVQVMMQEQVVLANVDNTELMRARAAWIVLAENK